MKKYIIAAILAALMFSTSAFAFPGSLPPGATQCLTLEEAMKTMNTKEPTVTVTVAGKGFVGYVINDRTYIPVRSVFEALGYDVGWEDDSHTVVIKGKKMGYAVLTDKNKAYIASADPTVKPRGTADEYEEFYNFKAIKLSDPVVFRNNRVMLPLRGLLETIGYTVDYDAKTRKVTIGGSEKTPAAYPLVSMREISTIYAEDSNKQTKD